MKCALFGFVFLAGLVVGFVVGGYVVTHCPWCQQCPLFHSCCQGCVSQQEEVIKEIEKWKEAGCPIEAKKCPCYGCQCEKTGECNCKGKCECNGGVSCPGKKPKACKSCCEK